MQCFTKPISFLTVLAICWTQVLRANTDYTEFEFGDASTPLVALGQEVLSSNDILECSPSNTAHINPYVFLKSLGLDPLNRIQRQDVTQRRQNQRFDNLLIGFPITALSKRMAIGAVITDVYIPSHLRPFLQKTLAYYKLGRVRVKELQPRLVASKEGGCLLTFDICSHRWNCDPERFNPFFQIPILGVSKKHQALIFDSTQLGIGLEEANRLIGIKFLETPMLRYIRGLKLEYPKTSIVDFSDSSLIFDVQAQLGWEKIEPFPQVTSRWFLKFDLVSSEEGFESRPPTKGIGYALNTEEESLMDIVSKMPKRITRRRIFKDGHIQPVKYYVKNVPEQYQPVFQRAFEYWQSIFTSLISHSILLYEFIQGDFDKDGQEILTGDVRFNVIEWNSDRIEGDKKGTSIELFNQNTGEIWSSYIVIYGAHLVDIFQKRLEYSKLIGESLLSPIRNYSEGRRLTQIDLFDQLTAFAQAKPRYLLPLTDHSETFESYVMGVVENVSAHEIGHTLGFKHNYMGSAFADDTYVANTKMDYLSNAEGHKKTSDDYDKMGIGYGYLGIPPHRIDMFCGSENLIYNSFNGPIENLSPECATQDPSSRPLQKTALEIREIIGLLTTKSIYNPSRPYIVWNNNIKGYIVDRLRLMLSYYSLADTHYDRLQTVLIDGRRPQSSQEVKDIVLNILKSFTCDPELLNISNRAERINSEPDNFDQHLQENIRWFFHWFYITVRRRTDISISGLGECLH